MDFHCCILIHWCSNVITRYCWKNSASGKVFNYFSKSPAFESFHVIPTLADSVAKHTRDLALLVSVSKSLAWSLGTIVVLVLVASWQIMTFVNFSGLFSLSWLSSSLLTLSLIITQTNRRCSRTSQFITMVIIYITFGWSMILPSAGQSLAMTDYYNCYITPETSLACLGLDPTSSLSGQNAYAIPSDLIGFVQVVGGSNHTCGLLGTGEVRCFGDNTYGQSTPPMNIGFTFLAAGTNTTCGIMNNGSVTCFGQTFSSGISLAFSNDLLFKHLSCGNFGYNTILCGVLTNGTLQCVGPNVAQQTLPSSNQFVQVTMNGGGICGLLSNGTVQCSLPETLSYRLPSGLCVTSITNTSPGSNSASCAVTCSAAIVCWAAQIDAPTDAVLYVQAVMGNNALDGYTQNLCAIDQNGQIQCNYNTDMSRYKIFPGPNEIIDMHSVCLTLADQTIQCGGSASAFDFPPANLLSSFSVDPNAYDQSLRVCAINTTHQLQCFQDTNVIPPIIFQQSIIDSSIFYFDGCVLKSDGRPLCWNRTDDYIEELGLLGSLLPQDVPFVSIRTFHDSFELTGICGLAPNGTLFCGGSTSAALGLSWPQHPFGSVLFKQLAPPSVNEWHIVCGLDFTYNAHCFSPVPKYASQASVPLQLVAVQFTELMVVYFGWIGFLICGLTALDQSIWCWGGTGYNDLVPLQYHLIGPFHHLMGHSNVMADSGICFFTTPDNTLKCLGLDVRYSLPDIFQSVNVGSLAPLFFYRSGLQLLSCPIQTLSTLVGALSPICDGPCQFDNPLCIRSCPIGYYCRPPLVIICPKGAFCVENTVGQPSLCPAGTYGNTTGLTTKQCSGPCPPGYLCNDVGTVDYLDAPCPGGHYCPDESTLTPTPCPAGRFGLGGLSNSNCTGPCPSGFFCQPGTIDYHDAPCPASSYCPSESTIVPIRCSPGSYCEIGSVKPLPCDAGTYGTDGGYSNSTCAGFCPHGYLCPNGTISYAQYPCPAGQYCPIDGTLVAPLCEPGYWCPLLSTSGHQIPCGSSSVFCPAGSATPTAISTGFYANGSADGTLLTFTSQLPCEVGHYCDGSGLMKDCAAGTYQPEMNTTSCLLCSPGSYSLPVSSSCSSCTPGTFTSDTRFPCVNCTAGQYSLDRASSCLACPLGRASNVQGLGYPCDECTNGTYAGQAGLMACLSCLPPYYNPSPSVCLLCTEVVSSDYRTCTSSPCPKNTQYDNLDHTCPKCPLGEYSLAGSSCQSCALNTFTPHAGYDCISCQQTNMDGLVCEGGLANVIAGYWAFREYDSVSGTDVFHTVDCPVGFCLGGALQSLSISNTSINTTEIDLQPLQCQFPRLQSADNYLCGACADGYLLWNNECHLCESTNWGLVSLSIVLSFGLVVFLLRSSSSESSSISVGLITVLIYFVQTGALEVTNISKYLDWYTIVNIHLQSLTGSGTSNCIAPVQPVEQVLLELLTPILLTIELGIVMLMHWFLFRYRQRITLQQSTHNLAAVGGVRNIPHQVKSAVHGVISSFDYNKYVGGVLAILLFCYTLVAETCVSWFSCIRINADIKVLFRFPDINCASSEYYSMLAWTISVFLVYIVGLPIGIILLLRRNKNCIQHSQSVHPEPSLSRGCIQSNSDSEHIPIENKSPFNDLENDFIGGGLESIESHSDVSNSSEPDQSIFLRRFGCLFRMYHGSAWYWQSVVLLRRLLFVVIHIGLLRLPNYRFLGFSLVNLISMLMIIYAQPFRTRYVNNVDVISQTGLLILSLLLSLLPPYPFIIQMLILVLLLIPTIVLLISLSKQFWTKRKEAQTNPNSSGRHREMVQFDEEAIQKRSNNDLTSRLMDDSSSDD